MLAVSQAVASGALDVGISNPVQLGNAISHGIPFVFLAGAGAYSTSLPTTVLCVAKDGPIHAPKDFAGQTIAVSALKDLTDLAQQQYLEKNGVESGSVKTIELPFAEMGPGSRAARSPAPSSPSLRSAHRCCRVRRAFFTKVFDAVRSTS